MNRDLRLRKSVAALAGITLVVAACGGDDDDVASEDGVEADAADDVGDDSDPATDATDAPDATEAPDADPMADGDEMEPAGGGTVIDAGSFTSDPPEHLDPALNTTLNGFQVNGLVYNGLTDLDVSDPDDPQIVPLVAETVEANDDATVWTFTIRADAQFSDGTPINASTFQDSWERVADLAGNYSYLLSFIEGGAERLAGEADTITGIEADDETRTLTVTMDEPYANFDAVAGFQLFYPVPPAAVDAGADWENGLMIGNGPYAMESQSDQEIALVKNDNWLGDADGNTWDKRPDAVVFRVSSDIDTAFNVLEAGEADLGPVPPGRQQEILANWGSSLESPYLGVYYYQIDLRKMLGGDENIKLRQAILAAIDRDEINEAVYQGTRQNATSVAPEGIPGWEPDLCEYCVYDPDLAQQLYDEWVAEGGSLDGPIPIQFNADSGHEGVVAIVVDNLAAVGIEAEADPFPTETYFSELADGACVMCRAGWIADYPTYDNFMFDLFHSSALDGNNYGFDNAEFDALVDEAKRTVDKDAAADLYRQAEDVLLNQQAAVLPINWYTGNYSYDPDRVTGFEQLPTGRVLFERIELVE